MSKHREFRLAVVFVYAGNHAIHAEASNGLSVSLSVRPLIMSFFFPAKNAEVKEKGALNCLRTQLWEHDTFWNSVYLGKNNLGHRKFSKRLNETNQRM